MKKKISNCKLEEILIAMLMLVAMKLQGKGQAVSFYLFLRGKEICMWKFKGFNNN